MKKLLFMVLALILVCSLGISAAAARMDVSASAEILEPGETVVITVSLKDAIPASDGATVMQGELSYNGEALELRQVELCSADLTDAAKHTKKDMVVFHYLSDDGASREFAAGDMVRITFAAKQDIAVDHAYGDISFRVQVQNAQGQPVGDLTCDPSVSVIIAAEHDWADATYTRPRICRVCNAEEGEPLGLPAPAVTAAADAQGRLTLTWDAVAEADAYKVYRSPKKNSKFEQIAVVEESVYVDASALVGTTYYYQVQACYSGNPSVDSPNSAAAAGTATCAVPECTVQLDVPSGKPAVSWNAVDGAKKYDVYRADSLNGQYKKVKTVTALTYTDTSAKTGSEYYYRVSAVAAKAAGNSSLSGAGFCRAICGQAVISAQLDAKTGLPALSWKAVKDAKAYEIYRSAMDGDYELLASQSGVKYTDKTAETDTAYTYKVKAISKVENGNGEFSEEARVVTTCTDPVISAVTTEDISGYPVIAWNAVDKAARYEIACAVKKNGPYTNVGTTEELTFVDETAQGGTTYFYKVAAVGANSISAGSACKSICARYPQPVITVDRNDAAGKPEVTWNAVDGAKKYDVYRAESVDGAYKKIKTVAALTYIDTSAKTGNTYFYKVCAVASTKAGNSILSEASPGCRAICAQPQLTVKLDEKTGRQPTLTWKKIADAAAYEIWRSQGAEEPVLLSTQTALKFVDTTARSDVAYRYGIYAIAKDPANNSAEAEPLVVQTTCAKPVIQTVSNDPASGQPVIGWGAVEGAEKYEIFRSTNAKKGYVSVGFSDALRFTDRDGAAGTKYYYTVAAVGCNGSVSAVSDNKSITCRCAQPVVTLAVGGDGSPVLSWNAVDGAKQYTVYRATAADGKYSSVKTVKELSYTDTKAKAGVTYFYKVVAVGSGSAANSSYSNVVTNGQG